MRGEKIILTPNFYEIEKIKENWGWFLLLRAFVSRPTGIALIFSAFFLPDNFRSFSLESC